MLRSLRPFGQPILLVSIAAVFVALPFVRMHAHSGSKTPFVNESFNMPQSDTSSTDFIPLSQGEPELTADDFLMFASIGIGLALGIAGCRLANSRRVRATIPIAPPK